MEILRNPSGISPVLLTQAINGDNVAFKSIYNDLSGTMYSLCLRYAKDKDEANDFFQDGFVKVFLNLSKFRHEGSFEGWARQIFVRTCLDFIKKRKLNYSEIDEVASLEADNISGFEKLSMDDLMKIIQSLPEGYRTIVNLYFIEGYTHNEIADMLGIAEGTSKSQLSRARIILKKKMTEKLG
jgi:RNA polymerase sigma factor (sigma-70 family)